jgi:acylglycerol lipase
MTAARAVLPMVLLIAAGCAPTVIAPGPPTKAPVLEADRLVTADGVSLPVRAWMPAGEPRAVIVALHGFNDYGNFFAAPGAFLAERGIATYAYDQRGFGKAPVRGLWSGGEAMAADLTAMTLRVRERHPGVPLHLLGASMGGAVIMVAMTGNDPPPADGIILSAPAVWGRETMPWYQRAALWVASHTVPWLKVTGRGLKIRPSDNIEMLKALAADSLVLHESRVDTLHGLTDLMGRALAAAPALTGPALVLYGEHDEIIPPKPTRLMFRRLRGEARLALYDKGFHMLLRDLQGETVWKDIDAWIADGSAPLPSGADQRAETARADDWRIGGKP